MSKRRRRKKDEEHISESWLIPYADILTLLLALFIVLFASSAVDAQKFQALSRAFNNVLSGGSGIFDFPSPVPEGNMEMPDKEDDESQNNFEEKEIYKLGAEKGELEAIQNKVESYIQENNLDDKLETSLTGEGLLVSIRDNVLFASGSAEVREEDIETAHEIADLLVMDPPRNIIISGHTDNVPIRNANFESNWELSVMRAVNFMKVILQNDQLDPSWFSAKGFGEFQPVASNETSEGRARNRRVEILIMPNSSTE
ncbi:flagellar motor protein MotB [Bacillaceae bacterium Marseille-Q3522]|nr:flagellar motor protein MotB [Bacillaceae bacterium Marseille-Q3522]